MPHPLTYSSKSLGWDLVDRENVDTGKGTSTRSLAAQYLRKTRYMHSLIERSTSKSAPVWSLTVVISLEISVLGNKPDSKYYGSVLSAFLAVRQHDQQEEEARIL
ncbi:hypothetical protein GWI33_002127 [Rhynchophorus ferrugineus]|uniref:Uncharacterized protein n=1 Tax=Rhynchophorus ferrugineus TaxID=354439 RepID=A0A834HPR5_RHYFE|nr:hypothetical protein GWI33_002127 [Rhynchophorus ferrugineus]